MSKKLKDIKRLLPKKKDRNGDNSHETLFWEKYGYNTCISELAEKEIEIDVEKIIEILKEWTISIATSNICNVNEFRRLRMNLAEAIAKACPIKMKESK